MLFVICKTEYFLLGLLIYFGYGLWHSKENEHQTAYEQLNSNEKNDL